MNQKQTQHAVIAVDGKQIPVYEGQTLYIDHRNLNKGSNITFSEILAVFNNTKSSFGLPYIKNAKVIAEVLEQVKGDKVNVLKKKRRKGYKVENGFRKTHTHITIKEIVTK